MVALNIKHWHSVSRNISSLLSVCRACRSYPWGQRNDSRLLEECQTQIQDNEDVQEHLRQPVVVEQIEPEKKTDAPAETATKQGHIWSWQWHASVSPDRLRGRVKVDVPVVLSIWHKDRCQVQFLEERKLPQHYKTNTDMSENNVHQKHHTPKKMLPACPEGCKQWWN